MWSSADSQNTLRDTRRSFRQANDCAMWRRLDSHEAFIDTCKRAGASVVLGGRTVRPLSWRSRHKSSDGSSSRGGTIDRGKPRSDSLCAAHAPLYDHFCAHRGDWPLEGPLDRGRSLGSSYLPFAASSIVAAPSGRTLRGGGTP